MNSRLRIASLVRMCAFCLIPSPEITFVFLAGLLCFAITAHSQSSRRGLITQAISETSRITLPGNVHPLATRAADRGPVPESMPADRMLLLLKRSPEEQVQLREFLESLQDTNSPNFHKWLTPQQFGAQWGPADSDIAAVTAWLQSHGFAVAGLSPGRIAIEFSGTASQLKQAFQTEIHTYSVNGEIHHANNVNPTIPAALSPVVAGIATLNDFHPKAPVKRGPLGIYNTTTRQVRQALTSSSDTGNFLYVGPADAATIYDTPVPALNPNYTGKTIDGTGAIIGVAGEANINLSQDANYRKLFGLAANAPTVIVDGGVNPGINSDSIEFYLDTQISNGIAPGARLYFYTSAGTDVDYGIDLAVLRAVDDNVVDVLSLSWEECEAYLGASGNYFVNAAWEQAAAQGISVSVASSDSGSAGCDDFDTQTVAISGLQVNGWSSTPYNISVGGTDFSGLAAPDGNGGNFRNYVSLTSDSTTLRSANKYIPEAPWNDSVANFPIGRVATNQGLPTNEENIVAGSGGSSNCTTGYVQSNGVPVCSGGYARPSWQSGPGTPPGTARDLPDISMLAGDGVDFAAWAICTDQETTTDGQLLVECTPGSNGLPADEFYLSAVGGTSAAAPAFAGVLALVKSATGERQGQADHVLYSLLHTHPEVFHDIVSGNNSVPCAAGSPGCAKNTAGYYYETGFNAGSGYDLATGLGSIDAAVLIANWASTGLGATTTTLTAAPTSIVHGTPVTIDATVTSSGGTPQGDVALIAGVNPSAEPNNGAVANITLNTSGTTGAQQIDFLPGGSYNLLAHYGGSETFAQSTSAPIPLKVTPETSTTSLTINGYSPVTGFGGSVASLPYGYYLAFDARPYGNRSSVVGGQLQADGIATGNVAFTLNSKSFATAQINAFGYAEVDPQNVAPGSYALKASYAGDASFDPSSVTRSFTITKGATQIGLSASASAYVGKPIVFTVTLSTSSIGAAPTGVVALRIGSDTLAEGALIGAGPTATDLASGKATISVSSLPAGQSQIVAVYLGDANYASSISNSVAIAARPFFTVADISFKLHSEHSTGSGAIVTTSVNGYTGTVKYTCQLLTKTSTPTPPECGMYPASEALAAGATIQPLILIFGKGTKLPTGVTLGSNARWAGAGGAVLACCLFFGIPARRRRWRSMLSALLLLVAIGGFSACIATPKMITHGLYTFKVTATDSSNPSLTATATVTVEVL
jgi:trimeric autotransporter adhesin